MVIDKESPFMIGASLNQECPGTFGRNLEIVFGRSSGKPGSPGASPDLSALGHVGVVGIEWDHIVVPSLEDDGNQITSVIVEVSAVIRPEPMMDTDAETEDDKGPTVEIRTLWTPQSFLPTNLKNLPEFTI